MKRVAKFVLTWLFFAGSLTAFTIDPFPKNGTLNDIFNANCLQMTQSQQMLKAYIPIL
jgi:hypothetical protein